MNKAMITIYRFKKIGMKNRIKYNLFKPVETARSHNVRKNYSDEVVGDI